MELKEKLNSNWVVKLLPWMSLVLVVAVFGIATQGRLFRLYNLQTIFSQTVVYIIGGLGLSFLFSQGAFDLSYGSNICFSAIATMCIVQATGQTWLVYVLPFVFCVAVGVINGLLYSRVGLMIFVQTLAVSFLLKGTFTSMLGSASYIDVPRGMRVLNGLPFAIAVTLLMSLWVLWVFNYTTFGKHCRMVGAGQDATIQSGVDVKQTKLMAFVVAGLTAGLVCIISMARAGRVSATTASNFEFNVMIALTLGGMPAEGGAEAKLRSVFIGCFIVSVLANGMVLLGIDARMQEVVKGIIFILVLIFTMRVREKQR